MNNLQIQSITLLASFVLAFFAVQGCKTTHIVHIHKGEPVPAASSKQTPKVQAATAELPVDITLILDRSGSMQSLSNQVILSFNDFLEEQKTIEGEATVSLVQFNHEYSLVYEGIDLQNAKQLNTDNYHAIGNTALFDAIGRTIQETKERVKPGTADVVFVITTDGLENASQEYSGSQIKDMIAECETDYGWHFMYLAANDDAFDQHRSLGIDGASCYQLAPTAEGWKDSQKLMSIQLLEYRNSRQLSDLQFKDEDRVENPVDDGC